MLTILILTIALFGLAMFALAVGVIFRGKSLRGSCQSGTPVYGPDGEPLTCSHCTCQEDEAPQLIHPDQLVLHND